MRNFFSGLKENKAVELKDLTPWKLYGALKTKATAEPVRECNDELNNKLYVYLDSITRLSVDAIVNAANNACLGGGGVDGAIHAAAGPGLRNECRKLNGCNTGDAKITEGHELPAAHVIHTVGPRGRQPEVLTQSYTRCYEVLIENNLRTIAFPCISTGVYGYPNEAAADVALSVTRDMLEEHSEQIDAVVFCLFTREDIACYHKLLPSYFPLQASKASEDSSETSQTLKDSVDSETIKDSEASETMKDSEASETVKDSEASKTVKDSEASETVKDSEAEETVKDSEASETVKDSEAKETVKDSEEAKETVPEVCNGGDDAEWDV